MFPAHDPLEERMFDVLYVTMTAAFFGAMLWYTRGCASLGRGDGESKGER